MPRYDIIYDKYHDSGWDEDSFEITAENEAQAKEKALDRLKYNALHYEIDFREDSIEVMEIENE